MARLSLISLLLILGWRAAADAPASEEVVGTTGMALCCRPVYWNCYQQCPMKKDQTDAGCLSKCETLHCVGMTGACAKAPGSAESSAQSASEETSASAGSGRGAGSGRPQSPAGTVYYDGKLTGPGTVHFEAYHLGKDNRPLQINGLVFGRLGLAVKVLKTTPVFTVLPGKPSKFTLKVPQREFEGWNKSMTQLTVAIGFADESEKNRWRYENLLTQRDQANARPGEFQVKGGFTPATSAGK